MNVDLVARRGERLINEAHNFPYLLGRHETGVAYIYMVHREEIFEKGRRIRIRQIEIEDVGDSESEELGDVLSPYPASLVDARSDLFGFKRHEKIARLPS
jgi:hypothetical protein